MCGSPDWRKFADSVVDQVARSGSLSFLEAEQLRRLDDPRRILSIAKNIARDENIKIDYDNILHPRDVRPEGQELYRILKSMRPVFVTTNYDKWLDEPSPSGLEPILPSDTTSDIVAMPLKHPLYYRPEHFTTDRLTERGAVIHLHGSWQHPDSMIISLRDYISHYVNDHVRAFLKHMFRNHTVLFIGYSLAEIEILEYAIRADETKLPTGAEARHFILWPFLSSEAKQTKFMSDFFSQECDVKAIPYCVDERGFAALIDLARAWEPQIDVQEPSLLDLQIKIDQYINEGESQPSRDAAIRLLLKESRLIPYFFNKVRDSVWFNDLQVAGLFDTEGIPGIETTVNPDGSKRFSASDWPALRYLQEIAEHFPQAIPDQLAEIIISTSNHMQLRKIDNWRVYWSLASVLARLPLTFISLEHITCVKQWILSRFDNSMVGHELVTRLLPRLLESKDKADADKALALVDILTMIRQQGVTL